jgi:hypothetical protein
MTKKEFLARCGNAFDAGVCTDAHIRILERWCDMVMRLEGGQVGTFAEFLEMERERLNGMYPSACLANDKIGYGVIQFAAILRNNCQKCAVDPKAWWTRPGLCEHHPRSKSSCGEED